MFINEEERKYYLELFIQNKFENLRYCDVSKYHYINDNFLTIKTSYVNMIYDKKCNDISYRKDGIDYCIESFEIEQFIRKLKISNIISNPI